MLRKIPEGKPDHWTFVYKRNGAWLKKRSGMEGSKGSTVIYFPFLKAPCSCYCMQH